MRKIFLLLCLFPLLCFSYEPYVEFKIGARRFTESDLRKIYTDWCPSYGVEAGVNFCDCFIGCLNYGYAFHKGRSYIDHPPAAVDLSHHTEISMHNLDVVVKALYACNPCTTLYAGIGPRLFIVSIDNSSPYVQQSVNKSKIGGVVTGGLHVRWRCLYLDPFFEYGFIKMHFSQNKSSKRFSAHFDNVFLGVGIGMQF